jgi:hypothetical protein
MKSNVWPFISFGFTNGMIFFERKKDNRSSERGNRDITQKGNSNEMRYLSLFLAYEMFLLLSDFMP